MSGGAGPSNGTRRSGESAVTQQSGLFGPASLTWRVHSDPLMGIATLRALALRAFHPEGLAAVYAMTRHADDIWQRVARTLRYISTVTFGTTVEAVMAGARARAIQAQVSGRAADGRSFRGDDPDLMLWVHCCHVSSVLDVVRRGGLQLELADQDGYLKEQLRAATVWGLEPEEVPASRSELAAYFRRVRPALRMTHEARTFLDPVVTPPLPAAMLLTTQQATPEWAPMAGLAFAALPVWARQMYARPYLAGPAGLSMQETTTALRSLRESLGHRPASHGSEPSSEPEQ